MGQNRRYGSDLTDKAIARVLMKPAPISLSPAEVGEGEWRDAKEPVPVKFWVRFPETPLCLEGRAVGWNDRAVRVDFEYEGAKRSAIVWASAVERS